MMHYLSGLSELGRSKRKEKAKAVFSKPFKSFSKSVKKLDAKAKALNKKIVEDAKRLAEKTGRGKIRKALIPRSFAFKKFIFALEKDLFTMSSRLKALYIKNPAETKLFLSSLGDYTKIINAINKGAKGSAISGGYDYGCKCGNQNVYAVECCKGKHSAKSMVGDVTAPTPEEVEQYSEYAKEGLNFIQKIIEFFKKKKAERKGDNEIVPDLNDAIDTDPNIPVVDENGKPLPESDLAPKTNGGSMMMPIVIGGAVLVGGYFLLKKKK
ncbi:MAG: LPXTG cell wall anchor domain-containing protein [Bacteroidota bacterium]